MSIGLPYSCFFCPNLILSVRYIWEKTGYLWRVLYKKSLPSPSVPTPTPPNGGCDAVTFDAPPLPPLGGSGFERSEKPLGALSALTLRL